MMTRWAGNNFLTSGQILKPRKKYLKGHFVGSSALKDRCSKSSNVCFLKQRK